MEPNNRKATLEAKKNKKPMNVALYVTCLLNTMRPQAAQACVELIEATGHTADVPMDQTCCGQPGYNNGHQTSSEHIARHQISTLLPYDAIVVPSASCCGMIRNHYPKLLANDPLWHERAQALAAKTFELSEFLLEQQWQPKHLDASAKTWAHHTSCSCLRETQSAQATQSLLGKKGVAVSALKEPEVCCGFGGTFSSKFSKISARMAQTKLKDATDSNATAILSSDFGCLMHLEGVSKKQGMILDFKHLAEVLNESEAGTQS